MEITQSSLRQKKKKKEQLKKNTSEVERSLYLLENPAEITNKVTEEIINGQIDIKLGHLTDDKGDVVLKAIKRRKYAGLSEIPHEI